MLGRGREAHVCIDDAGASRPTRASCSRSDGRYVIEDLGSRNGTFVDGRRVDRAELRAATASHIGPNVIAHLRDPRRAGRAHRPPALRVLGARPADARLQPQVPRRAPRQRVAYARRHKAPLSLIMFDIDHFKQVNDTLRPPRGRRRAARRRRRWCSGSIRAEDVFARYGGEEFVVLVRGIEHDNAGRFAERVRAAVEELEITLGRDRRQGDRQRRVRVARRARRRAADGRGPRRLADERLYRAKAAGRNRSHGE